MCDGGGTFAFSHRGAFLKPFTPVMQLLDWREREGQRVAEHRAGLERKREGDWCTLLQQLAHILFDAHFSNVLVGRAPNKVEIPEEDPGTGDQWWKIQMTSKERQGARVVGGAISVSDCEIDVGGTARKRGRQRVKFNKEVVKREKSAGPKPWADPHGFHLPAWRQRSIPS